jgi:hypothetical protein
MRRASITIALAAVLLAGVALAAQDRHPVSGR